MTSRLLLIAILFSFFSCTSTKQEENPNSQKLTIRSGTNMSATVSPDGQNIIFDVLGRLWLMPMAGGEAIALTDKHGNARQPAWSPDGQQICFQAYWDGNWHIYTIDREGKQLNQITSGLYDHREPYWSPNGQMIIYASDTLGSYDLWEYDLTTKISTPITSGQANEYAPVYSSDGKYLAYISDNPSQKGIVVRTRDSGEENVVYASSNKLFGVTWHPSGNLLTLNEYSFGYSKLLHIDLSGEVRMLSSEEDVFPFRTSWLDEENYIYTANGQIQQGNTQTSEINTIPFSIDISINRPAYEWRSRNYDPAENLPIKGLGWPDLSPTGEKVALVMMGDVWIVEEDGTSNNITNDHFLEISPVWSPDGNHIAYLSDRTGQFELWVYQIDQQSSNKLSSISGAVSGIAWAPDGKKIAISTSFGPRAGKISSIDIGSGKLRDITPMMSSSLSAPSWSSDGEVVAFSILNPYSTLYREGINGVWRYGVNGKNLGRLEGLPHFSFGSRGKNGPLWSPDGKYYAATHGGKLWIVPVDLSGEVSGSPVQLTDELADNPSWSGDGKHLLYIATDRLKKIDVESKTVSDVPINQTRNRTLPTENLIIHAGNFFDGLAEEVSHEVDILISGHRIEAIVPHSDELHAQADREIDAGDKFVMPGLIDAHSHQGSWDGEKLGRAWLSWGVTATRDPTSDPYDALSRREGQESGHLTGPTIYFTGGAIDGNRVYYAGTSPNQAEDQADLEINRADLLGYDMIKTYVRLPDAVQKSVIEKAHKIGLPVSSHELYPAVANGIDGIEHILGTSRRGYSVKMSRLNLAYEDVTSLIAKSGMSFTPTTGIYVAFNYILAQDTTVLSDPRLKTFVDPFFFSSAQNGIQTVNSSPEDWKRMFQNALKMVKDVHDQGGLVIAGTDSPIIPFGFSLHIEMESYAMAGLTNFEVLQAATIKAAKALHADKDIGSLEEGKLADILILDKNPLEDIGNTKSVHMTIQNGRVYTLAGLLEGGK